MQLNHVQLVRKWKNLKSDTRVKLLILTIFSIWLILVFLAPFTLHPDQIKDLSGNTGTVDNPDQLEEMNPLARLIYTMGDIFCHQNVERSFYLNGNQMPFCARDVGIFLGLLIGISVNMIFRIPPTTLLIVFLMLPLFIDGMVQGITDYESTNSLRILTGILGGTAIGLVICRFIQSLSKNSAEAPP